MSREPKMMSKTVEMTKRATLAAAAVFCLALGLTASASATMPGGDGLLVFSSQRDGNAEIYSSTLTGATQVRLTNNPAADFDPVVSPDGSKIAFVSDRDEGDREIYVMDADGSNQTRITNHVGDDMDPSFSPDGTRLAIRRNVSGNNEIFVIDAADGGNPVNLTDNAAAHSDFQPDWSPDGSKIVYQRFWSGTGDGFGNEVMLMNADGSDPVNLTNNANTINDGRPSFSPDGTRIAFDSNRNDSRFEIYTMRLDGESVTRVTDIPDGVSQEASFSPSGSRIAFRGNAAANGQVNVVPAAGGTVSALTGTEANDKPSWQIDNAAPVTTLTGGPEESGTSGPAVTFTFTANEPEVAFECRLDEGAWESCASPWELDELAPGPHSVEVRATDLAGNVEATPAERNWTVDATAPLVSITSGPDPLTNFASAEIAFETDQSEATTECRLDPTEDSAWTECESPFETSDLAEGAHRFEVRATSQYNVTGAPVAHEWTIDSTPPVVEITLQPDAVTGDDEAGFEFTVDDPEATTECRLDSIDETDWSSCSSPVAYTGLADGEHRFELRATDQAGNASEVASYSWQVDLTPPVVTIESGPAAITNATDASVAFTIDEAGSSAECRLDSTDDEAWAECESPFETAGLTDGDHLLEVRATDGFGNVGAAATHEWTVDTDAPEVTIESAPDAVSNSIRAEFTFTADESGSSAECRLDPADEEAAWEACASPVSYNHLEDGPHRFEVRVTDPAGNRSPAVAHEWEVSTVKPVASILDGPDDPTAQTTATFTFEADNPGATFECRLDPAEDSAWSGCTSPAEYTGLEHGEHRFEVRATETDQGTGPVAAFEWTVDTVAPVVELTGTPAPISGTADPVFSFTADEPGTTAECRLDPAGPGDPWVSCVSPTAYTGLAEGPHRFEVRVTDPVGQVSDPVAYDWIVETTPPVATIESGPESLTTAIDASFTFSTGNPNAFFECRLDGAAWETCVSGIEYDQLGDGTHEFEVRAVGQGAGPGPVASHAWTVDTIVPTLVITSGPAGVTNATDAGFSFEASKPGFTFRCQLDGGPAGPCISPLNLSGLDAGDHSLLVELIDADDNVVDSAGWDWSVLAAAPVASITTTPAAEVGSGTAVFEFEADVPEASFECRIDGGSWKGCNSPAVFTELGHGPHSFAVRAGLPDSVPGPEAGHDWSVDLIAPEVRITGGPGPVSTARTASFAVESDDPTDELSCRLDDGPWSACSDPLEFSDLADGEHILRVRAVDGVGNTAFDRYDWTIDATAPVLTLNSVPAPRTSDRLARFGFAADDPEASFECQLDGGEWKACTSVHELVVENGTHQFALRASDRLGNVSETVSHSWEVAAPAPRGLVPALKFKGKVKLNRRGVARIAAVTCPEGRCRVIAPRRVKLRVGGRKFKVAVLASRNFNRASRTEVKVVALARARNALLRSKRAATLKIKVTVVSDNGKRRAKTKVIRVRGR